LAAAVIFRAVKVSRTASPVIDLKSLRSTNMKRKLFTVIRLTTVILPGIALAQNAVTEWNNIAVATTLAGNSVIPPNS